MLKIIPHFGYVWIYMGIYWIYIYIWVGIYQELSRYPPFSVEVLNWATVV